MPNDCISYQESGYFSNLIIDYLNEEKELRTFYNRYPKIDHFYDQIIEKKNHFPISHRQTLVEQLKNQHLLLNCSDKTIKNLDSLLEENTFTITTGHQLNLFTGPLYFIYKIISTINLCNTLKEKHPEFNFVPVYWMATEDHDFDEINFFNLPNKKIQWTTDSSGPVGRLKITDFEKVIHAFESEIGTGQNADLLKSLFRKAYLEHSTLAQATRYLTNELFKDKGLVIIDGDNKDLKKIFVPYLKNEILNKESYKEVKKTILPLSKKYNIQVSPREINLFYIRENIRERIVYENDSFKVLNTSFAFDKESILNEIENFPERFSPNVILRPLYQEVILPNICYIGGGGELAYWLELKSFFESQKITFPMLLLRDSVLLSSDKQLKKISKLDLTFNDLFVPQQQLTTQKTKEYSKHKIDFTTQKDFLKDQFFHLKKIAQETDNSFLGAVDAQEKKQLKGLEKLEKRLLKAEKKQYSEKINRIISLQNELFPNQSLQERKMNFSFFYKEYGDTFFSNLYNELNPLEQKFKIITF